MKLETGDPIHLEVTPDRFVTVRYAGASGDLPGRILHGLWTMAQVARAHTDAAGGPEGLKRLSVQFRGMGRMKEPIVVSGAVRVVEDGVAVVDSQAEQSGHRIIRNAVAEISVD